MFRLMGSPVYLGAAWGMCVVMLVLGALILRKDVRIKGPLSWFLYLVFGPIGGFFAMPIINLSGVGGYILPLAAVAMVLSSLFIRFIMPAIAYDFQTESFSAAMMLAFLIAISVSTAGYLTHETPRIIPQDAFETVEDFPEDAPLKNTEDD
ncbi:MAG: hypothetical protein PWP23_2899 [Candidatus Sumerlaeota bacterium]|nr:hypothetical protein [Candidatus Sumerlaeota bacterium]